MKKDTDPAHAEHKSLLDALANTLNEEVERGLKLLDTCATQIGQAKWILVNVKNTIKEFHTECPVCEDHRVKAAKSKAKEKEKEPVTVKAPVVAKKDPPPPVVTAKPKPAPPAAAASVAPVTKAVTKPANRPGPRSKTRPNQEPEAELPALPTVALPKTKTIVVKQTAVKVLLNNISPYLKGRTALNLNSLTGYDPCLQERPADLHFKPIFMRTASGKVSKYSTNQTAPPKPVKKPTAISPKPVGLASKKFMEDLSKERSSSSSKKYKSREIITDTSSSSSDSDDEFKPLISLKKAKAKHASPPPKKKSHSSKHKHSSEKHKDKSTSSSKHKSSSTSSKDKDKKSDPAPVSEKASSASAGSSHSKPATTRMTITLKPESDSLFDKIKEKTSTGSSSPAAGKPKMIDFTKRESSASSHHVVEVDLDSDSSSIGKPITTTKRKPFTPSIEEKKKDSSASHVSVDMEPPQQAKPIVAVAVKSKPGPASKKKAATVTSVPPPAPSSVISEASHRSDAASNHSEAGSERSQSKPTSSVLVEDKPKVAEVKKKVEVPNLKRKLSPDSSTVEAEPAPKKKDAETVKPVKANLFAKLQKLVQKSNKSVVAPKVAAASKSSIQKKLEEAVSTTTKVEEAPKLDDAKEDKEEDVMELGDDIIGKCIDNLETDKDMEPSEADSPAKAERIKFPRPPSFHLTTSPAPTLQDCVSPTGVDKFFKGPDGDESASDCSQGVETAKAKLVQIARAQELMKRLSHSEFEGVAALHSQDKISELFADLTRKEMTTERGDLLMDTWYLVEDETLGYATSANSVDAIQWNKIPADKLKSILAELETYTLSCIR